MEHLTNKPNTNIPNTSTQRNTNEIQQRNNETKRQFQFRKNIYDEVLEDTKDQEKAMIYSNILVNIYSLGCSYPEEVMEMVEKYKPAKEENVYLIYN